MNQMLVIAAFDAASDGFSVDRVVAAPALNIAFLEACFASGLSDSAADLNHQLMNLRKAGALTGRPPAKRTQFSDQDDYRFAAEMAIRFMERKHDTSVDRVVCDPVMVAEFDELTATICPGFSTLQYRWAALGLRKARGLEPEVAARILKPESVLQYQVSALTPDDLPNVPGLYLFFDSGCFAIGASPLGPSICGRSQFSE